MNERHINIRKRHDAKQKDSHVVYLGVPRGWFEEDLQYQKHSERKKNCGCGGLLGRVVACELKRLPRFLPKEYMAEQSNSCIVRQKY